MPETAPPPRTASDDRGDRDPALPVHSSRALLGGQREAIIQHGAERYRLRLTGSNKLILVK